MLTIKEKLLTMGQEFRITEGKGKTLRFILKDTSWTLSSSWRLTDGEKNEKARVKSIIFSWTKKWKVSGVLGNFYIRKPFFAWNRKYEIIGGPYDGVVIKGDWADTNLEVSLNGEELISAEARFFSSSHDIYVHDPKDNILAAIVLCIVMKEKVDDDDDE